MPNNIAPKFHLATLPNSTLQTIKSSSNRETIGSLPSRIWDMIVDWFCHTERVLAKKYLFDIYSTQVDDEKKKESFDKLEILSGDVNKKYFHKEYDDFGHIKYRVFDFSEFNYDPVFIPKKFYAIIFYAQTNADYSDNNLPLADPAKNAASDKLSPGRITYFEQILGRDKELNAYYLNPEKYQPAPHARHANSNLETHYYHGNELELTSPDDIHQKIDALDNLKISAGQKQALLRIFNTSITNLILNENFWQDFNARRSMIKRLHKINGTPTIRHDIIAPRTTLATAPNSANIFIETPLDSVRYEYRYTQSIYAHKPQYSYIKNSIDINLVLSINAEGIIKVENMVCIKNYHDRLAATSPASPVHAEAPSIKI